MNKGAVLQGLKERYILDILASVISRFLVDSTNRLAVTLVGSNTLTTVTTVTTTTTLTNLTNWGLLTATARTQVDTYQAYQVGPRRNLTVS